jgi:hypothetical protein
MAYLLKFLRTVSSPVKNIFPALNIVLVLIIVTLTTFATRTWMDPKYPDKVDVDLINHAPKALEPQVLGRRVKNSNIINATVQGNLFRKDRREFSPPVQIAQVIQRKPAAPALPPPNLKLKGVMLLGAKKIAIMEGSYPVREGNRSIQKKPLKRKGYSLGAKIGDFELTGIEKNKVTLNNNRGVELNLNLTQRSEGQVIRKVGNSLIQKNKNFDPAKIKKASPRRPPTRTAARPKTVKPRKKPKPVPAPRSFRISGAPTSAQGKINKPHVSGR